ncbi:MAG: hypothetical protein EP318_18055 [Rhodobacteraceae bacterium]|nr:MAG: hypothetical protein EP318_18055 [Paracoccaceae bacterium]
MKLRHVRRIVSMAGRVVVVVNTGGRREILGIWVMPSETFTGLSPPHRGDGPRSPFRAHVRWSLTRGGLRGVLLVIGNAHEDLEAFVGRTSPGTVCQPASARWRGSCAATRAGGRSTCFSACVIRRATSSTERNSPPGRKTGV